MSKVHMVKRIWRDYFSVSLSWPLWVVARVVERKRKPCVLLKADEKLAINIFLHFDALINSNVGKAKITKKRQRQASDRPPPHFGLRRPTSPVVDGRARCNVASTHLDDSDHGQDHLTADLVNLNPPGSTNPIRHECPLHDPIQKYQVKVCQ